jgi:hypothetical protein
MKYKSESERGGMQQMSTVMKDLRRFCHIYNTREDNASSCHFFSLFWQFDFVDFFDMTSERIGLLSLKGLD